MSKQRNSRKQLIVANAQGNTSFKVMQRNLKISIHPDRDFHAESVTSFFYFSAQTLVVMLFSVPDCDRSYL